MWLCKNTVVFIEIFGAFSLHSGGYSTLIRGLFSLHSLLIRGRLGVVSLLVRSLNKTFSDVIQRLFDTFCAYLAVFDPYLSVVLQRRFKLPPSTRIAPEN